MQVGDVKWVNLGGDGNGSNPLGIIPKNIVQLVTSLEAFGVDIPGLIGSLMNKNGSNGSSGSSGSGKTLTENAMKFLDVAKANNLRTKKKKNLAQTSSQPEKATA